MLHKRLLIISAVVAANVAVAAYAQNNTPELPPTPSTYSELVSARPPVTDQDITDRPYRILGEVRAEVRKATIFSRAPSRDKVFRELWERAVRLRADAVVNARAGGARVTAMSWGSRRSIGQAVKFLTDAEIAAGQTGERRPLTDLSQDD
ncbi:MAG TPA: hypothetical protein VMG08_15750 [Allosphingosinicella sp.]|nr:hypothetical protein [Allosphingosinicella sp.]